MGIAVQFHIMRDKKYAIFLTMNDPVKRWEHAYGNALVSGTVASITSTVALSMLGKAELDKSAAPLNGPSQWIWGRHAPYQNHFSFRYTVVGYLIHHAASVFWATGMRNYASACHLLITLSRWWRPPP